jgi:hypothetical protein
MRLLARQLTLRGTQAMLWHERITRIRCAPKRAPCPTCGRRVQRKRILHRRLRTLAYRRIAWLEVTYAECRWLESLGACQAERRFP